MFALSLFASIPFGDTANAIEPNPAGVFDFRTVELKILDSNYTKIGSTRFTVSLDDSTAKLEGMSTYIDGEQDDENEVMHWEAGDSSPRLDSYQHRFFGSDGSLRMTDTLDAATRIATCTVNTSGGMKVRRAEVDLPTDTFAGAADLMMVAANLRRGIRTIEFHTFACVPGPRIFSVKASLPKRREQWSLYPGDLVRLDLRPDLGLLNALIAPFVPRLVAWFNPNDNWMYVGGEFDGYFRGPHVLTVRVAPLHR